MRRKVKRFAGIVVAFAAALLMSAVSFADNELGDNYLGCYGDFEGMIPEGETEYPFINENFAATVGGTLSGGKNTLKKEGENTYLEMSDEHTDAFGDIWMRFNLDDGGGNVLLENAGKYTVSFRYYKEEGWQPTPNAGFRIYQNDVAYDVQLSEEINAAAVGQWVTAVFEVEVAQAGVAFADSIHLWVERTEGSTLRIDDLEVRYQLPSPDAPKLENAAAAYNENTDGETGPVFQADLKGYDIVSVCDKATGEELAAEDYSYDAQAGTLTIAAQYCRAYGDGQCLLVITTEGGSAEAIVNITLKGVSIPDSTEGYVLLDIMNIDGTFESYDECELQDWTDNGIPWSFKGVADCGFIYGENGGKMLKLTRENLDFADIMMSYDVGAMEVNSIVTMKFDVKYTGTAGLAEVSFVGASNIRYHRVELDRREDTTAEDNENQMPCKIVWTEKEDGWYSVEYTFATSFALLNSCDRVRILMDKGSDGSIYLDNIEMLLWTDENSADPKPVVETEEISFDGSAPSDIVLKVNLKEYPITTIVNGATGVKPSDYALSEEDTVLTISKEYLQTLENGEHTFRLITLGGETDFMIRVSNHTVSADESAPAATGGGNGISPAIWAVAAVAAVCAAAAIVVAMRRKRKN